MLLCVDSINNGTIESTEHTHRYTFIWLHFSHKGHTYLTKMFLPVIGISVLDCVIEAVLRVTVTNEISFNHDVKIDQHTI